MTPWRLFVRTNKPKHTRRPKTKLSLLTLERRDVPAIIANPGFETPLLNVGQFQYAPAGAGWTFNPSAGITANFSGFNNGNPPSPEGGQVAFIQGVGNFSQVITLTAGTYAIDFLAAQRGNIPSKETFNVLVDGQIIGNFNSVTGVGFQSQLTTSFPGTAGNHTLTFQGTNLFGGDNATFIDQVIIRPQATPLIDNGFEVPSLSPGSFQYNPPGAAWSYSGSAGISENGSGFTIANSPAPEGSQVAFMQGGGSFSQVLTLTQGTYSMSFLAAQRANFGNPQTFQVFVSGTLVGSYDSLNSASYVPLTTSTFSVATGVQTITFQGTNIIGGDSTALIDDIVIHFESVRLNDSGFEMAGVARGQFRYQPPGTAWTFGGTSGVTGNASAFTSANAPAPQGSQVAFLQQTGSISQLAGFVQGTYEIGFLAAQRGNQAETFQLLVDGIVVGTYNTVARGGYQPLVSSTFTVTSGNHTITVQGTNLFGGDNTVFIDDLKVFQQPTDMTDSGFELPAIANGTFRYGPAGSPWSFTGTAGVSTNNSAFTSGNHGAPQGNQVLFLQQAGSVQQVVPFTAGTYEISFFAAQRRNVFSSQTFQVLVDGVVVTAFNNFSSGNYVPLMTSSFTVGTGNHIVTFRGTNLFGGDNSVFIDDVAIISDPDSVNDNGFESPALSPGQFRYNPPGSPWAFNGTAGFAANGSAFTGSNPPAPQGSQVLFLQQLGAAAQVVNLAEGTYNLSFLAAQRGNVPSVETFQVLVDNAVVATLNGVSGIFYQQFATVNFTVGAGNHTITFNGTNLNGGDNTALIDQVIIRPV
ncbi:MAG: hypothetical protein ACJ8C4_05115 [Gemmataceae bacterium]